MRWAAGTRLPSRGERHGAGSIRHWLDKALKGHSSGQEIRARFTAGTRMSFEKAQMFKVIFKILLA